MTPDALLIATLYNRLTVLQEALESVGWNVQACQKPSEALQRLRTEAISAVFCDEYLRGSSPSGFLAWSRRVDPERPFYLFSVHPDRTANLTTGTTTAPPDEVLPFPPQLETLPSPPSTAEKRPVPATHASMPLQGDIALLPLASLLDMMGIAQQSGCVFVEGEAEGLVVLEKGVLQHIETRLGQQGVRALAEMIHARSGSFRVEPYRAPKRKTLMLPAATALTEAAKLLDELDRDRALVSLVRKAAPNARAVVTGYPLSQAATFGEGDVAPAFALATKLFEANRSVLSKVSHLSAEGDGVAVALVTYGEGNLLAATGASGQSLKLLAALAQAVRSLDD